MTDYRAFHLNLAQADPTRTLTLRNKWAAEWNRRIGEFRRMVLRRLVDEDFFGLKDRPRPRFPGF